MKKRYWIVGAAATLAAGVVTAGAVANDVEQPGYTIEAAADAESIEIRQYPAMIVAEVTVKGSRDRAMGWGFRILADYIFGNNTSKSEIAMTSPVTQQSGEKIAMTSPVTQQPSEKIAMTSPVTQSRQDNAWTVRFIMPSEYTMETLPTPNNEAVTLLEVPGRRVAAIRFSGRGGMAALDQHTTELRAYLAKNGLEAAAEPTYAFYDGPWVPGPLRRNEVMIELAPAR